VGSSKRHRKLQQAEDRVGPISGEDDAAEREKLLESAREVIGSSAGFEFDCCPLFRIDRGRVFSMVDGKEVTRASHLLAEEFYWLEVKALGIGPGHVHHKEAQEIRTTCGRFIINRERFHLGLLMHGRGACQCLDCQKAREEWRGVGGTVADG
jgi:hypothetical protein